MGILVRSRWQRLPPYPLLTMQNNAVQAIGQNLYFPSSCTEHLMDCMKDMAFGHWERSTSTPLFPQEHQLLLPSIRPLTSQFRFPPGRITFPLRKTSSAFLSAQYNVGRRVTPTSLQTGKNHAQIIQLQGSSVAATGTFSYDKVPMLSRETPTLFLPGSA